MLSGHGADACVGAPRHTAQSVRGWLQSPGMTLLDSIDKAHTISMSGHSVCGATGLATQPTTETMFAVMQIDDCVGSVDTTRNICTGDPVYRIDGGPIQSMSNNNGSGYPYTWQGLYPIIFNSSIAFLATAKATGASKQAIFAAVAGMR